MPICLPAILDVAVYMFVNAMTTVSSVIFLYAPGTKLASVAVVHMEEAGVTAGLPQPWRRLIVATALAAKLLHVLADKLVLVRLRKAWRKRWCVNLPKRAGGTPAPSGKRHKSVAGTARARGRSGAISMPSRVGFWRKTNATSCANRSRRPALTPS